MSSGCAGEVPGDAKAELIQIQNPLVPKPSSDYTNWESGYPGNHGDQLKMMSDTTYSNWQDDKSANRNVGFWAACQGLCPPSAPPATPPPSPPRPPSLPCQNMVVTMWNPSGAWGGVEVRQRTGSIPLRCTPICEPHPVLAAAQVTLDGVAANLSSFEGGPSATFSVCRVPGCYAFSIIGARPPRLAQPRPSML